MLILFFYIKIGFQTPYMGLYKPKFGVPDGIHGVVQAQIWGSKRHTWGCISPNLGF
jgi:hypothetical protein